MHLGQFLSAHTLTANFSKHPVIFFRGGSGYPLLFFSLLVRYLRNQGLLVETISLAEGNKATIFAKFETTFLGTTSIFWLGDGTELDQRTAAQWHAYCTRYQGPNTLMWFVSREQELPESETFLVVELDDAISVRDFNQLAVLFGTEQTKISPNFVAQAFKLYEKISLDQACLLLHYGAVLGGKADQFFAQWARLLFVPEKSLFTLSQYFFARDAAAFFKQWALVGDDYPEVFWTTFWSEQVWRAFYYAHYARKKDFVSAKKIGMRLPFSFMQRDWKNIELAALRKAHDELYVLDYRIKNGGTGVGLELFFQNFMKS